MPKDYGQLARELRTERAEEARRLREAGLSLRQIAGRLGCDHTTVKADLGDTGAAASADMGAWMRGEVERADDRREQLAARALGTPTEGTAP